MSGQNPVGSQGFGHVGETDETVPSSVGFDQSDSSATNLEKLTIQLRLLLSPMIGAICVVNTDWLKDGNQPLDQIISKTGVWHQFDPFICDQIMLSAFSASQMDHLHVDINQTGLLQPNGFTYSIVPSPNNIVGSYVPFIPQLSTPESFNHSLPYGAWLQGVQSALIAMTSSAQLSQSYSHSSLPHFYPPTPSTDLSSLNGYTSIQLTNSSSDPVCSPVSRSTPTHDSNTTLEDPDQPLALVIRKYTDPDRLYAAPIHPNSRPNSPPNSKSFSSSISICSTNSHRSGSSSTSSSSPTTDPRPSRPTSTTRRPKSKPAHRHHSQVRRIKANARERCRVHTISTAFEALRQIVPTCPTTPRLSKLSVLRVASCYIEALRTCLNENAEPNLDKSAD